MTDKSLEERLQKIEGELIECKRQLNEKTDLFSAAEELILEIYDTMTDKCTLCDEEVDPWEGRKDVPNFYYRNTHLKNKHGFENTTYAAKYFKFEKEEET